MVHPTALSFPAALAVSEIARPFADDTIRICSTGLSAQAERRVSLELILHPPVSRVLAIVLYDEVFEQLFLRAADACPLSCPSPESECGYSLDFNQELGAVEPRHFNQGHRWGCRR